MAINEKLMTADDLLNLPDDGMRHELVRGELRTMPPTGLDHAERENVFGTSLRIFVRAQRLGRVYVGDPGFRLTRDPDTVRAPDVAFIRSERLPEGRSPRGYFDGAPDLAVEVVSPTDRYGDVADNVAEWIDYGALMVFVVNPRWQTVDVHRPGQPPRHLTIDDTLDGEDVVPGWTLAVRDLFDES
jgi:Uma2 family endonuclease